MESLGLSEQEWNALVSESPTKTVFQTYQWMSSWEKIFGQQCVPWYISVGEASSIVGVAPLTVTKGSRGQRVATFLGDGKADYCDFLLAGDRTAALEKIFEQIFADRGLWDVIEFNSIPAESPTIAVAQAICREAGYYVLQRDLYSSPALLINGHEEEASKIFNKVGLRRRQNYFHRQGSLTFKTLRGFEVMPYMDRFFAQHISRWAGSKTPSLFLDDQNQAFYLELVRGMSDVGWLVLSVVELNDRPLAMHCGFDYGGRFLWYKPSFDVAQAKHSPGLVLLRYLIGHAIEQKRAEFDFSIGDEPFKFRFANHVRTTVQLRIYKGPLEFALGWSRQKLGQIKRRITRV